MTSTSGGFNGDPSIDDAGGHIAFMSNRNIGGGNPDTNFEVYLHDTSMTAPNDNLIITTTPPGIDNREPSINGDGTRVAFSSNATSIGVGNPDGSREIWRYDNTVPPATTQLTDFVGEDADHPALNSTGTRVAFEAQVDLGGNPDNDLQVILRDTTAPGPIELTTGDGDNYGVAVNAAGTRVAFNGQANVAGGNPDGNDEVWIRDTAGDGGLTQVTRGPEPSDFPEVSTNGTRMVFTSRSDLVGDNPSGLSQIFLATCGGVGPSFTDVPPTSVFYDQIEWMLAAEVASGFPDGTFKPQDPVKRQQMANFLYNLAGQPPFTPPVTPTFSDVPTTSAFFEAVEWMADEQIASGFPDGTFKPQDPVKRQQMANFMFNFATCCEVGV